MPRLREPGRERMMGADNADAATPSAAAGSMAPARDALSRKNTAPSGDEQAPAPGAGTMAEVTADKMIWELEEARALALKRGQASAAVTATLAKARLAGLLNERGESTMEPLERFDGNYAEALRRMELLLRLAAEQTASGQRLLPQSGGAHGGLANDQTASGQKP